MEMRKSSLGSSKMCRFCLTQDGNLSSLYERKSQSKNAITLPLQIMSCVSVEVFPSDGLPTLICERCKFFMENYYLFKQLCRQSDESIMQYIQVGESIVPTAWPQALNKLYRQATTVATKKKTKKQAEQSAGSEEFDDDDENVYSIKIGDDHDGDNQEAAVIKVVKTGDELVVTQDNSFSKAKNKGVQKKTEKLRGNTGQAQFSCDYCDKVYHGYHTYSRHLKNKHKVMSKIRGPFGECASYHCDECSSSFRSQDELIYHSAKHAAENLICPLCHEKFNHVEEVTEHIHTHVDGAEFMCDLCELMFTSKEKLDLHLLNTHGDELKSEQELQDDMDNDEEEVKDSEMNVTEENGQLVVEIKKPKEFMKPAASTNLDSDSEESDSEGYSELRTVQPISTSTAASPASRPRPTNSQVKPQSQLAHILKKAEEVQKKLQKPVVSPVKEDKPKGSLIVQRVATPAKAKPKESPIASKPEPVVENVKAVPEKVKEVPKKAKEALEKAKDAADKAKESKEAKQENTAPVASTDKSLRLLEKELQELKRTTARTDSGKIAAAKTETPPTRGRGRPSLHTSTPKASRAVEEKKLVSKTPTTTEKRVLGRASLRDAANKDAANKDARDQKSDSDATQATPKSVLKNGAGDRSSSTEDNVRRSHRTSKVKDYAKMIKDNSVESSDDSDDGDEEYKAQEEPVKVERRGRPRKKPLTPAPVEAKAANAETATPTTPAGAKKRGRPRKAPSPGDEQPAKLRKSSNEADVTKEDETDNESVNNKTQEATSNNAETTEKESTSTPSTKVSEGKPSPAKNPSVVSPSGQTLKPVPIKSLPPGVKPLPLPVGSNVCEMQFGKKMVKVQKIVISKAEVEAMAKKGLLELKDGNMVLKPGVKLPNTQDAATIRSTLVGEELKQTDSETKMDES